MYKLIQDELNIQMISKKIDCVEINISKVDGKILFFYKINSTEEIEEYIENLVNLFQKNGYNEIIQEISNDESVSNRFINNDEFSLPEFLWDIYVVFISNLNIVPENVKNRIERNDFFARKIIVEGNDNKEIINNIKEILFPEYSIYSLAKNMNLNNEYISEFLFNDENGQTSEIEKQEFLNFLESTNRKEYNLENIKQYLCFLDQEIKAIKKEYISLKGEEL